MTNNSIKVVFLDVDGTLLSSKLELSMKNLHAIRKAGSAGINIILASGRPFVGLSKLTDMLSLKSYVITLNGGCIINLDNREVVFSWDMIVDNISLILTIARKNRVSPCVYTSNNWFVEKIDDNISLEIHRSGAKPKVLPFEKIVDPVIKILLIGDRYPLRKCEKELLKIKGVSCFYTYPEYLEIIGGNVSKGKARDQLLDHLKIPLERVLAIGDGVNDISLLQDVGLSVAMENAHDILKNTAEYITLSNDDDGVAIAIDALIHNDEESLNLLKRRS